MPEGAISSLSFTVRYPATGTALTDAFPAGPVPALSAHTAPVTVDGWAYTTFLYCGTNASNMVALGTLDKPVVVARIPVPSGRACSDFTLLNDAYTHDENRDYYVAVNGTDITGRIQGTTYGAACGPADRTAPTEKALPMDGRNTVFSVFPNPNSTGTVTVAIDASLDRSTLLTITWLDALGQVIGEEQRIQGGGAERTLQLDRPAGHNGLSFLRIGCVDQVSMHSVIFQ